MTLTRESIEAASPRELDALVAEYVFGESVRRWANPFPNDLMIVRPSTRSDVLYAAGSVAAYSTSGDAMCEVLEWMLALGWVYLLEGEPNHLPDAVFYRHDGSGVAFRSDGSKTLQEAVSRSALYAVLSQKEAR